MSFYNTILQEAIDIFHTNGVESLSEQALIKKLNVSNATFYEFFEDKEDLLTQAITASLDEERELHRDILNASLNAVEEVMGLLAQGVQQLKQISPLYFQDLVAHYPAAWELYLHHSRTYTVPLLTEIIERGIKEDLFCNNLNPDIITRIILGQVNVLLDQALFPAAGYQISEVYKTIYLHLVRGICTAQGVKITEKFFAVNKPVSSPVKSNTIVSDTEPAG